MDEGDEAAGSNPVRHPRLRRAYGKDTTSAEKRVHYDDWAATYDADLTSELGYVAPGEAAGIFAERVGDRAAKVLDAGCGTGLAGVVLAGMGYTNLHGFDLSPKMLERARAAKVYATLGAHDLTKPFPGPLTGTAVYDAALSVGVFAFGPPHIADLHHITDAVRPGGWSIVTVNGKGWREAGWDNGLPRAARDFAFEVVEIITIPYLTKPGIDGRVLVLRSG